MNPVEQALRRVGVSLELLRRGEPLGRLWASVQPVMSLEGEQPGHIGLGQARRFWIYASCRDCRDILPGDTLAGGMDYYQVLSAERRDIGGAGLYYKIAAAAWQGGIGE